MFYNKSIHIIGLLSSIIYSIWLIQSVSIGVSLASYLTGNLVAFLLLWGAFSQQNLNQPKQFQIILFWAILFRLLGLFSEPILEDDHYRYLWDGYQFVSNGSPYGRAPADFFTDEKVPQIMQAVLDRINYPEVPTIYGPVSQAIFAVAYLIAPASLLALKCLLIGFDIAGLFLLKRFANNNFFIVYAWNPLIIKEIAFSAHQDAMGIFFLIAAIYVYQQQKQYLTAINLALAVAVKAVALVFVPLMIFKLGFRSWVVCILALGICYLPFLYFGNATDLMGIIRFADVWEFNSSLFGILQLFIDSTKIKLLTAVVMLLMSIILLPKTTSRIPRGDVLFAVLLLLSPVVNPWYVLWLMPFAVIYPSRWAWLFSFTVSLSYITGLNLQDANLTAYNHPLWLRFVEYLPVLLVVYWDWKQPLSVQNWQIKNEKNKSR
jgi:hypothetical protein